MHGSKNNSNHSVVKMNTPVVRRVGAPQRQVFLFVNRLTPEWMNEVR
jgi:hypothetical protein